MTVSENPRRGFNLNTNTVVCTVKTPAIFIVVYIYFVYTQEDITIESPHFSTIYMKFALKKGSIKPLCSKFNLRLSRLF